MDAVVGVEEEDRLCIVTALDIDGCVELLPMLLATVSTRELDFSSSGIAFICSLLEDCLYVFCSFNCGKIIDTDAVAAEFQIIRK